MGNELSARVPASVAPVDSYIADLPEHKFEQRCISCVLASRNMSIFSLGTTRFLKVARTRHAEGACVVKVFVHRDPPIPLEPYRMQVERTRDVLSSAKYCTPYRQIIVRLSDAKRKRLFLRR